MSAFMSLLNRELTVSGLTDTGQTDGGGNTIYTTTDKGTVRGRIDPQVSPTEVNGPDLNPVISDYLAITTIPSGFTISERDTLATGGVTYEILGVSSVDGRIGPHHLEMHLRKVTA